MYGAGALWMYSFPAPAAPGAGLVCRWHSLLFTQEGICVWRKQGEKRSGGQSRDRGDTDSSLITSFLSVVFYFFSQITIVNSRQKRKCRLQAHVDFLHNNNPLKKLNWRKCKSDCMFTSCVNVVCLCLQSTSLVYPATATALFFFSGRQATLNKCVCFWPWDRTLTLSWPLTSLGQLCARSCMCTDVHVIVHRRVYFSCLPCRISI